MTPSPTLNWSSAALTHIGNVRKINEDACLNRPEAGVWVVADGMGGHNAGDLASYTIVKNMGVLLSEANNLEELMSHADSRLQLVNSYLIQESAKQDNGNVIGSTVVTLLAHGKRAGCLWAGDSRAYLCRNGEIQQLTKDHSLVEQQIEQGILRREDAESSPVANVITRAVGAEASLKLDSIIFDLIPGDTILLCSDGLYRDISNTEFHTILTDQNCESSAQALIDLALKRGAKDNITAVTIKIKD